MSTTTKTVTLGPQQIDEALDDILSIDTTVAKLTEETHSDREQKLLAMITTHAQNLRATILGKPNTGEE